MTDISIRDLMFQQRMQEIENDILDWGFVDDGLDYIAPATADQPWSTDLNVNERPWIIQEW